MNNEEKRKSIRARLLSKVARNRYCCEDCCRYKKSIKGTHYYCVYSGKAPLKNEKACENFLLKLSKA